MLKSRVAMLTDVGNAPTMVPEISIVTVVRNGRENLEKTILSVLAQKSEQVEYIIVDGASSDGTVDIIEKYSSKLDSWVSEPDNGIYDAVNKGVALATGKCIA